jgi:hypothetical protein
MLEELETEKQMKSPYPMTRQQIEDQLMPQVVGQIEQLQRSIRDRLTFSVTKEDISHTKQESSVKLSVDAKVRVKGKSDVPIEKTLTFCEKTITTNDLEEAERQDM